MKARSFAFRHGFGLFALALAACSDSAHAPAPAEVSTNPPPAVDAAPFPEADVAPLLDQLTQSLRKFSAEKQRVPASLDELVAAGYLPSLPRAPAGYKFTINPKRVEVLIVKQ